MEVKFKDGFKDKTGTGTEDEFVVIGELRKEERGKWRKGKNEGEC